MRVSESSEMVLAYRCPFKVGCHVGEGPRPESMTCAPAAFSLRHAFSAALRIWLVPLRNLRAVCPSASP